ncbi:MAG: hypothetical protein KBG20_04140 [Caldilineaceae bacterium]|nr:hypothetical protein [Caldilineaceae bacterium]MBP8106856.1 hypothetical protein [Caldilineaceae bacterium]MBP8121750.1 hypothetical protein [Caldilineaceae bacterium]MBP9071460.1 hypothetical protein [Caldilineaceae bacterium]
MGKRQIENLLRTALLKDGSMAAALYDHELAEHLDYWYAGLLRDEEAYVFAVTEHSGDVAMVLITRAKEVYVNEGARAKLRALWPQPAYARNMKRLIPVMADQLANNIISVNGVKKVADGKR